MKSLLFLLFLSSVASAQNPIEFSEVVNVDSTTKEQLFTNGRAWMNEVFKSGKDVTQVSDKEAGELSGKVVQPIEGSVTSMTRMNYTAVMAFSFRIQVKDGKYKYTFYDFDNSEIVGPYTWMKPFHLLTDTTASPVKWPGIKKEKMDVEWNTLKDKTSTLVQALVATLKQRMAIKEDF